MADKPFESRIQDLVYNVDVGLGLHMIRGALYLLFVFLIVLLYTATQFKGFKDAEAMEYAQLGRNVMNNRSFVTQVVRPATMWYMTEKSPAAAPMVLNHPDIMHPPVYPALLAAWFKVNNASFAKTETRGIFPPDYLVVMMNHMFSLGIGVFILMLGIRLFDRKTGMLAMTLYYLSNMVWLDSIAGTPLPVVMFFAVGAYYFGVVAVTRYEEGAVFRKMLWPVLLSGLFAALCFLTRYAGVVVILGLILLYSLAFRPRGLQWAGIVLGVFIAGIAPWLIRNYMVTGSVLGFAPYAILNETGIFPNDFFERNYVPILGAGKVLGAVRMKWMGNVSGFFDDGLLSLGNGLMICFFMASFFYRFVRFRVHLLRWALALSMVCLLALAALFGESTRRLIHIFWPFVILYGLAFFFIMLDRLQFKLPIIRTAVTTTVIFLSAVPLIFALLPPRPSAPYPPYYPSFIYHVTGMMNPNEVICTDMPWATAWYGNQRSLYLPMTVDEFYEINDFVQPMHGLYFTTLTRDLPYARTLATGPYSSWFPILEGRLPSDFPLVEGFPMNNMDQLFLTDRPRWLE